MRSLEPRVPSLVVGVSGLAAAYYIAAMLGLLFAMPPGNATAVWPASGIALAALLIFGNRVWPGIWIGATVAAATTGTPVAVAVAIGTGNTTAALAGTLLFKRLLCIDKVFLKVQDAFVFAVLAAATCTISASVGAFSIYLWGRIPAEALAVNWWTWWLGDVAGQMILLPLALALRARRWRVSSLRQWGELSAAITLLAGVSYCLFGDFLPERLAENLVYVTLLFLIWVALRFDLVEVALTTGLLSIAAIWGTCRGIGAFGSEGFHPSLFNVQIFTYVYSLTGLAMSSVVAGRRFFEVELQESRDLLRHEVEERARTERAIRKSEATFRAVFASAPVMMLLLDEDRTVRATNPAADRMLESPDPIVRAWRFGNAVQCAHAAESPGGCGFSAGCGLCPVRKIVDQTYETGEPIHSREVRLTHKVGDETRESYYLMSTSLPDIADSREVLICIEDVTARKLAEEALLRSEERFDLAVRGSDAGVWDWDLRSNQVFFSLRWKRMLGYDEHEISNAFSEWESRLHPDDRGGALQTIQAYFRGERSSYQLEHRLRHKDGSYRWILARGAAVYDGDGKPYRMVGSHIDITSLKEAQAALRARDAELLAAQRIQKHLLPRQAPMIPGFDIAGASWPAELAAGDHFDYLRLPDGAIGIVVSDVSGHGFSSSLLMASTQAHLRSFATDHDRPDEIIEHVNRILCGEVEFGRFVTLLLVRLDVATGQLTFVNAGHPPGYLVDRSGAEKAALQSTSIPLGIEENTTFRVIGPLQFEIGDCLVLYTDGLFEAQNDAGDSFERQRVLDVVSENRGCISREIISRLHEAVCAFAGHDRLEDDVTIVVIKRLESRIG